MSKKKLLEDLLKTSAKNGKITCAMLRKISEDIGISYKVAGKTANELRIKINNCDFGCF